MAREVRAESSRRREGRRPPAGPSAHGCEAPPRDTSPAAHARCPQSPPAAKWSRRARARGMPVAFNVLGHDEVPARPSGRPSARPEQLSGSRGPSPRGLAPYRPAASTRRPSAGHDVRRCSRRSSSETCTCSSACLHREWSPRPRPPGLWAAHLVTHREASWRASSSSSWLAARVIPMRSGQKRVELAPLGRARCPPDSNRFCRRPITNDCASRVALPRLSVRPPLLLHRLPECGPASSRGAVLISSGEEKVREDRPPGGT